jgi:RNA polymerase sigma-70 factor (ECF subfamily)
VEAAWGVVDRHLRPRLLAYFQSHGLSRADGEDLVQTTLARVYRNVDGLRDDTSFLPWLFVIARNERRRWWEATRAAAAGERRRAEQSPVARSAARRGAGDDGRHRRAPARGALGDRRTLPAQQRQCLLLRAVHELSYDDIAATLRLSVHTVRNHLAQARQGLRRRLGRRSARRTRA